jgi:hypothetical protein
MIRFSAMKTVTCRSVSKAVDLPPWRSVHSLTLLDPIGEEGASYIQHSTTNCRCNMWGMIGLKQLLEGPQRNHACYPFPFRPGRGQSRECRQADEAALFGKNDNWEHWKLKAATFLEQQGKGSPQQWALHRVLLKQNQQCLER